MNKKLYIRLLEEEIERSRDKIYELNQEIRNLKDRLDPVGAEVRIKGQQHGKSLAAEFFNGGIEGYLD